MKKYKKILNSLSIKDSLNPKIWEKSNENGEFKIRDNIRKSLLKISEKFIDYLGDDIFIDDIILTGSLSNYNWSEYSDFDLHIIIDFKQFGQESPLYKELFDLKKIIFNEKHNIKIYGYDVELYAQDSLEPHVASGVYSIMTDEWVNKPKKINFELDKEVLSKKIKCWIEKIDTTIVNSDNKDGFKLLESLKKKLKEYRQSGLEKKGELSYENLVFKFLRRSGHIKKLFDSMNKALDKKLSVETTKEL